MVEEEERIVYEEQDGEQTIGFPILDRAPNVVMKNINPSILPTFYGMKLRIRMHSSLNLTYYVGITTMWMMLKN